MPIFSRFFYKRPPDGLIGFADRVYVFNSCFSSEVLPDGIYQIYLREIVTELHEEYPESSLLAFNFREGDKRSHFADILSEYDVTIIDYPRQYEGCPLLPLPLIQHFLRASESWLSLRNQQNIVLLHCERGGWPLLAFILATFLLYRKLQAGEQKTLDIIHREAPKGFLQLLSPLNHVPSQVRYLQYVARRNRSPSWPPPERMLLLDCVILRMIPSFDTQKGCRPVIRIFGRDVNRKDGLSTTVLFSMPKKKKKTMRHYKQGESDVFKIDIQCLVQGDVVVECLHLDLDPERETMMFRIMFNTAFIRSNILMLSSKDLDILWNSKDRYPKGFRAEVLFGEAESVSPRRDQIGTLNGDEKGGLPVEAFAKAQELFSGVEWVDAGADPALWLLKQISANALQEKNEKFLPGDINSKPDFFHRVKFPPSPVDSEEEVDDTKSVYTPLSSGTQNVSQAKDNKDAPTTLNAPTVEDNKQHPEPICVSHGTAKLSAFGGACTIEKCTPGRQEEILSDDVLRVEPKLRKESDLTLIPQTSHPTESETMAFNRLPPKRSPPSPLMPQPQDPPSLISKPPPAPVHTLATSAGDPPDPPVALFVPAPSNRAPTPTPPPPPPPPTFSTISPPHALHIPGTSSKAPPPPPPLPPPTFSTVGHPPRAPCVRVTPPPPPRPPPPFSITSSGIPTPPPPPPPPPIPTTSNRAPPPPPPLPPLPPTITSSRPPPPPIPPCASKIPPLPPLPLPTSSRAPSPPATSNRVPPPPAPLNISSHNVKQTMPSPPPPPPPVPPIICRSGKMPSLSPRPPLGNTIQGGPLPPPPPPPIIGRVGASIPQPPSAGPTQRVPIPAPPPPSKAPNSIPPPLPGGKIIGAPPPPPAVGKGRASSTFMANSRGARDATPPAAPKRASLKPLHWNKVTRAMQGSLWADAQRQETQSRAPEFDMTELEILFSTVVVSSDGNGTDKGGLRRRSNINKPEIVHLVDMRRANNCEIMLTKIKMPLPEMINAVLSLDASMLDIDQVENLIKFCPTKEEIEMLKNYRGDKEMLGKCEQFFLELMKVPRVESKLRVFSFKLTFSTQVAELRYSLNAVNDACREVRESLKLRRIMQTILSLGNALNQGTTRGSAIGFKLDSLLKLTDTRARNNKMTLMHYLCKVLSDQMPELLDFDKDLIHLASASKIHLKSLAEEMQAVSKGLEKVEQELAASENDGPVSIGFRKVLKSFLDSSEADVRVLISLYSEVGRNADSLAQYFGEDPARCPYEQVTTTLVSFVNLFNKSRDENAKQADVEKKKLEKKV